MFVKSMMKPAHKALVTNSAATLGEVLDRLNEKDFQGMPVIEDGKFLGLISRQMIYQAFFKSDLDRDTFLKEKKVQEFYGQSDLYITEDDVFEHTLTAFKGFPIIAVIDKDQRFLGIVSRYDVIEQFESAFGMKREGVRIAFTSEESEGRILRLSEIVKQYHENIISLATFDETDKLARRIVLKIEKKDNIDRFVNRLEKAGFRILDVKEG